MLGVRSRATNLSRLATYSIKFLGDHGEGETPVPIPNTEVKPFSADGTAWVAVWESRTLPRLKIFPARDEKSPSENDGLFLSPETPPIAPLGMGAELFDNSFDQRISDHIDMFSHCVPGLRL